MTTAALTACCLLLASLTASRARADWLGTEPLGAELDPTTPLPIDRYMSEVVAKLEPRGSCETQTAPGAPPAFARSSAPWTPSAFCTPESVHPRRFCEAVNRACQARFGNSRSSWCRLTPRPAASREDPTTRSRIFAHLDAFFRKATHDPEYVDLCCKGDAECRRKLGRASLVILRGLPDNDRTARYMPVAHEVSISESTALNCADEECIERTVLHELGHACQFIRHSWIKLNLPGSSELSAADLRRALGDDAGNCVMEAIREGEASRPNAWRYVWAMEAAATATFNARKTDLTHWAKDCGGQEDSMHQGSRAHIPCFLKSQPLRSRFCGR